MSDLRGDSSVDARARGGDDPPAEPADHLVTNFLHFARLLRSLGLAVTPDRMDTALRALSVVDLRQRTEVREGLRTVLTDRREQHGAFTAAFDLFWRPGIVAAGARIELGELLRRSTRAKRRVISSLFQEGGEGPDGEESAESLELADRRRTASRREVLRSKDFAELTAEEEGQVRQLMQQQVVPVGERKSRRRIDAARGRWLDLRRTVRRNLPRGGELLDLARRRRRTRPRPLVSLCDVSGSMESYSRILLQFLCVAGGGGAGKPAAMGRGRREAFAFGTRLTRLTPSLRHRDVDRALREAAAAVSDWGGGTRIGEALARFNRDWAGRVLGSGAVVLIISDGWDRGEPEVLAREMGRLRRTCDRLIWLNPLMASAGYEPLARGMAAALPFVDDFLPVHNLRSLEELRRHLEALDRRWASRPAAHP